MAEKLLRLVAGFLLTTSAVSCRATDGVSDGGARSGSSEFIVLPAPRTDGEISVEAALASRRSIRSYAPDRLTVEETGQLLWAAQGLTASWGGRTAPSAGGLYPLELYVASASGLWHYVPDGHRAEVLSDEDLRPALRDAALGQDPVAAAPAVFILTAVPQRTATKYGSRAERYVDLEAGHAAQNLVLQATAMGLGGVTVGAFSDGEVADLLDLPRGQLPLYLIPVGHPA
jgi:SagB-type dehydrogenase family enzyme